MLGHKRKTGWLNFVEVMAQLGGSLLKNGGKKGTLQCWHVDTYKLNTMS